MTRHEMIVALDEEIQRLETARTLLRRSRDVTAGITANSNGKPAARRHISAEGRRRIIEAQRRRWAKQKKEGGKGK